MSKKNLQAELRQIAKEHWQWLNHKDDKGSCADFAGRNLAGANLGAPDDFQQDADCIATPSNFRCANFNGANLEGASLKLGNFSNAFFVNANLACANLDKARFSYADFTGACLENATIRHASFRGADLRGADLRGADLRGAYLNGANLEGAHLSSTSLEEANFDNANLAGTCLDPKAKHEPPTKEDVSRSGMHYYKGYIYAWRTLRPMHCRLAYEYTPGLHRAPVFSVCAETKCHPGIYFASKKWLYEMYNIIGCTKSSVRIVPVKVKIEDAIKVEGKWRCKELEVVSIPTELHKYCNRG
jgi:hypothetical protein